MSEKKTAMAAADTAAADTAVNNATTVMLTQQENWQICYYFDVFRKSQTSVQARGPPAT